MLKNFKSTDSNTTNVKVKRGSGIVTVKGTIHSNTTNVKVKL